jgi:periplasmic divalent cation tolerance protein
MKSIQVTVTTFSSHDDLNQLVNKLLTEKLIACAQSFEVQSIYIWEEKIENNKEFRVELKHPKHLTKAVVNTIKGNHTYKVPEILSYKVKTSTEYADWCYSVCIQKVKLSKTKQKKDKVMSSDNQKFEDN